jgi:hypothetical protein
MKQTPKPKVAGNNPKKERRETGFKPGPVAGYHKGKGK